MGCCCIKTDEWRDSDSDISSLSELPTYVRRSMKTVKLRQHTSAGTQHACLDAELKGDSRSRCDEEPLESHPRVALPRLSTGGEENTLDGSNSFCSIRPIDADDLGQEQSQWATDEPGPSTVLQTRLLTPSPGPEPGLLPPPPGLKPGLLPTPPGLKPGLLPTPPGPTPPEFPQTGSGVDIPGPVSELQPSKAPRDCPQPKSLPGLSASPRVKPPRLQRRGPVSMGRRYQQREADKTKELDAERKPSPLPEIGEANFPSLSAVNVSVATVPATENKVGPKLTYAQVCRMRPRKRAPSPDLSPPYPDLRPPYPDLRPPYPDLRPPYPDLRPPYPDLSPPYPDLRPPYP